MPVPLEYLVHRVLDGIHKGLLAVDSPIFPPCVWRVTGQIPVEEFSPGAGVLMLPREDVSREGLRVFNSKFVKDVFGGKRGLVVFGGRQGFVAFLAEMPVNSRREMAVRTEMFKESVSDGIPLGSRGLPRRSTCPSGSLRRVLDDHAREAHPFLQSLC